MRKEEEEDGDGKMTVEVKEVKYYWGCTTLTKKEKVKVCREVRMAGVQLRGYINVNMRSLFVVCVFLLSVVLSI